MTTTNIKIEDIDKLAELARLDIPANEKESVLKDLGSILKYIDQISEVSVAESREIPTHRNVMREDVVDEKNATYTDVLLKEAPKTQDGFLKVKKIL